MPLIAGALLTYVCGLLAGFGSQPIPTLCAGALVAFVVGKKPRERIALFALVTAGLVVGTGSERSIESCAERVAGTRTLEGTLDDDANPGAFVGMRLDCGTVVRIAVRSGVAAGGSRVATSGAIERGRSGYVVKNATIIAKDAPPVLRQLRDAVGRGIDLRFGADAPLVHALLIADMADIPPAVKARFASAGLSHMLSVSGLHVGLIAAAVMLLAQLARLNKKTGTTTVLVITALYVLMIGAPLPAVRSAVMLGAASLSAATQRPSSPWAALALGACAPVFDPRSVLDVGFQLSVAGMVALIASGALAKRWPPLAARGWRGNLARGLATSTIATLVTAPLVAATFGRLSLVAPVTNLIAAPAIAILQPMLFLAGLALPIGPVAQFVADACHPLLAFIDLVAGWGATLPGAAVPVAVDNVAAVLSTIAAAGVVMACVMRYSAAPLVASLACSALLIWRPLLDRTAPTTEIHVIDVGQGDAIAVRSTLGRWLLFDAGRDWDGGDAGMRDVVPYIVRRGGTLEAFVLSHPHSDHVGGAASAIRALRPRVYIDPAYAGAAGAYRASLVAARDVGARWQRAEPGDSIVVDEIVATVLAPAHGWADTLRDPNEASVVVRVRIGGVSMLFTGDAEAGEERWLVDQSGEPLRADILKVAHHGSSTSSTAAFLDAVSPTVAVISVGTGNMYHHPSPDIVRSLAAHGALTLRTDRLGTIVLRTDGAFLDVEAGGERWRVK